MDAGWTCSIEGPSAGGGTQTIELERLDSAGVDWYASGADGDHIGGLLEVLTAAAEPCREQGWLEVVVAVLLTDDDRRIGLVVKRGEGVMFHTTFVQNRASIRRHGLDWRRFNETGIAGSRQPETDGIFLSSDLWFAEWFAEMGRNRGREVDIWEVRLGGQWLISDPSSGCGIDDNWMICLEPIPNGALRLHIAGDAG
jgi:hypothetical protein